MENGFWLMEKGDISSEFCTWLEITVLLLLCLNGIALCNLHDIPCIFVISLYQGNHLPCFSVKKKVFAWQLERTYTVKRLSFPIDALSHCIGMTLLIRSRKDTPHSPRRSFFPQLGKQCKRGGISGSHVCMRFIYYSSFT